MVLLYILFVVCLFATLHRCVQSIYSFSGLASLRMQIAVDGHAGVGVAQSIVDGLNVHVLFAQHTAVTVGQIIQAGGESRGAA